MTRRVQKSFFAAALLATMIGVAAPADASTKSRLRKLEKTTIVQAKSLKALRAQTESQRRQIVFLAHQIDELNANMAQAGTAISGAYQAVNDLTNCFLVLPSGFASFVPPGAVDPITTLVVSTDAVPAVWIAIVDASCVDPGTSLRGPRLRVAS